MNDTESDIGIIGAVAPRGSTQPVATLLGRWAPVRNPGHDNHPCPGQGFQPIPPKDVTLMLVRVNWASRDCHLG